MELDGFEKEQMEYDPDKTDIFYVNGRLVQVDAEIMKEIEQNRGVRYSDYDIDY